VQQDACLRIRAAKVKQLLDLMGELGPAAAEIMQHPKLEGLELEGFEIAAHRLELLIRELQYLTPCLRSVPVGKRPVLEGRFSLLGFCRHVCRENAL
jgi:two-component system chemotaxis sensor kinase CheA